MEKLELNWIKKSEDRLVEPRILIEKPELSHHSHVPHVDGKHFDNKLVHGDNLLALKALESEYTGEVKCIFIDPPYNTGSAFAQYDDGVEHSLWLSLMRDRLQLLKVLLSDQGSIWISIDDNESHYLKVLCDEVFGRSNFVANVVWQKKYTIANDAKWLSDNHDHILVYAKDKTQWRPNKMPRTEEMNSRYRNPDRHPKGPWKATPLHAKSGSSNGKEFTFTFNNGVVWRPPVGTYPRFSEETLRRLDAGGEIWFGKDGTASPSRKTFLSELTEAGTPSPTIWLHTDVGHNHEAREEVKAFNAENPFDTPKPERLLHRIIHLATDPGDIVLDSFAGSGTTGAVAHKMGRRWVMVELGQHCASHIVPRLKKVIDGEDPGGISKLIGWQGGGAFGFYELAPSLLVADRWGNFVINPAYSAKQLTESICKLTGFEYATSEVQWWRHGHSSERDFVYVTSQNLSFGQLQALADEVGEGQSLMVCCAAFHGITAEEAEVRWPNLTVQRISTLLSARCDWARADYKLPITTPPLVVEEDAEPFDENDQESAAVQRALFGAE